MQNSAIRVFAEEKGFRVEAGTAYGVYRGYLVSLSSKSGSAHLVVAAAIDDMGREKIRALYGDRDIIRQYRTRGGVVSDRQAELDFLPGARPRDISAFTEVLIDRLTEIGASADVCSYCGNPISGGSSRYILLNGDVSAMHDACADEADAALSLRREERATDGSVLTGILGAVLGAIVGAIPWAVAYYFGWFVGWLGFLIGIAAKKGYELLRGRDCAAKPVTVILAAILGVALAEFGTIAVSCLVEFSNDPQLASLGMSLGEQLSVIADVVFHDGETIAVVIKDLGIGLLFAALGIASLARDMFAGTRKDRDKLIRLN